MVLIMQVARFNRSIVTYKLQYRGPQVAHKATTKEDKNDQTNNGHQDQEAHFIQIWKKIKPVKASIRAENQCTKLSHQTQQLAYYY